MKKVKNHKQFLLTIITRTYNSADCILSALQSIAAQEINYTETEIVIVDDGSRDKTKSIIKTFQKEHTFLNINFIKARHNGPIKALNTGARAARGKFVILLDADDEFVSGNILSLMVNTLAENKSRGFVYGDYYEKNMQNGKISYISTKNNLFHTVAGGIVFKTDLIKKVGLYDEALVFPEYDLLIKLQKHKGIHLAEPIFTYKRRKGSITSDHNKVLLGKKQLFQKYGEIHKLRDY